ncbi:immunoglobulin lambda-like polypeptide 5 [Cervus elaphus]|uniref:immunoglobulin lambda-like polypeptide 5 n=1 Tax=Cervus elaphus TaxID=9860 RepID=UPI001CC2EB8C|nr:immunoglobulin lambda-like polypeptide 5 [Cervus elaphus]
MRSRPGQRAREAPRGQHGVPRQLWPLILLGLAVGAHGLLPLTAVPRNTAPSMEAPAGKSPWSLWDRLPLRPGPRATGPRCWPGVWAEAPVPWFLFGGGTKVIFPGKWLSPLPQPVPPSALSGKSLLSVSRGQGLHQGCCQDDRPSLYHLQVGPSLHPRSLCSRPPRTSSAPTRPPWCVSSATSTRAT